MYMCVHVGEHTCVLEIFVYGGAQEGTDKELEVSELRS